MNEKQTEEQKSTEDESRESLKRLVELLRLRLEVAESSNIELARMIKDISSNDRSERARKEVIRRFCRDHEHETPDVTVQSQVMNKDHDREVLKNFIYKLCDDLKVCEDLKREFDDQARAIRG